jgi:hypothetical protein
VANAILAAVAALGVEGSAIQTSRLMLDPVYSQPGPEERRGEREYVPRRERRRQTDRGEPLPAAPVQRFVRDLGRPDVGRSPNQHAVPPRKVTWPSHGLSFG